MKKFELIVQSAIFLLLLFLGFVFGMAYSLEEFVWVAEKWFLIWTLIFTTSYLIACLIIYWVKGIKVYKVVALYGLSLFFSIFLFFQETDFNSKKWKESVNKTSYYFEVIENGVSLTKPSHSAGL